MSEKPEGIHRIDARLDGPERFARSDIDQILASQDAMSDDMLAVHETSSRS